VSDSMKNWRWQKKQNRTLSGDVCVEEIPNSVKLLENKKGKEDLNRS